MPVIKLNDKIHCHVESARPQRQADVLLGQEPDRLRSSGVRKTNTKSFVAKGQLNGKGVLKTLGKVGIMTQDEARQAAREVFRDLGAGVHPARGSIDDAGRDLDGLPVRNDLKPRTKEAYADLASYATSPIGSTPR